MIRTTSELMDNINKRVLNLIEKKDVAKNLEEIRFLLEDMFEDMHFKVSITRDVSKADEPYLVNVIPSIKDMDKFVDTVVETSSMNEDIITGWQKAKMWFIELDHELLYGLSYKGSVREITALMIREILRVVYDGELPSTISTILKEIFYSLKYDMRQLLTLTKIRKIINIPIVNAVTTKNFVNTKDNPSSFIDKYLESRGYMRDYLSYVDKLLRIEGNKRINMSPQDVDREYRLVTNWLLSVVLQLRSRKDDLRQALILEMLRTNSVITKMVIEDIYSTIFGKPLDKFVAKENLYHLPKPVSSAVMEVKSVESLLSEMDRVTAQAVNEFFVFGKLKRIHQVDIDVIAVEIDKIETAEDKMYVLDRIAHQMDKVDVALDTYKENPNKVNNTEKDLLNMKAELEKYRARAIATRIIPKEYGVFIKYPKGYQG